MAVSGSTSSDRVLRPRLGKTVPSLDDPSQSKSILTRTSRDILDSSKAATSFAIIDVSSDHEPETGIQSSFTGQETSDQVTGNSVQMNSSIDTNMISSDTHAVIQQHSLNDNIRESSLYLY